MEAPGPLRAVRSWEEVDPDRGADDAVLETMLLTVGELGYAKTTVREVCERARIAQDRFHRRFESKEACFARAYVEAATRLAADIELACRASASWREGFRAGLAELLRFVSEQPLLAKALLIEVRAARGDAWDAHQRQLIGATHAIERARTQPGARPDASPMTAGFIAGAIEESLSIELATGRAEAVPFLLDDLSRLAFLQLFGEE